MDAADSQGEATTEHDMPQESNGNGKRITINTEININTLISVTAIVISFFFGFDGMVKTLKREIIDTIESVLIEKEKFSNAIHAEHERRLNDHTDQIKLVSARVDELRVDQAETRAKLVSSNGKHRVAQ